MRDFRLLSAAWGFTYYEFLLVAGSLAAIVLAFVMPVWGLADIDIKELDGQGNSAPLVTLVTLPSTPRVGEPVALVGAASDIDGDTMDFKFWINEQQVFEGQNSLLEWVFEQPGVHTIKFAAADNKGASEMTAIAVTVGAPLELSSGPDANVRVESAGTEVRGPKAQLVLESRMLATGDPVAAGLEGAGQHPLGSVVVGVGSALPGYAFGGWYRGGEKISAAPKFEFTLTEGTTLVAYLVKLMVIVSPDRLEIPESGASELVITLSAQPLLPSKVSLLEQNGDKSFLLSGTESIVLDEKNWQSGVSISVVAPPDADASDGSTRLVFGGEGLKRGEVLLVERDGHALLEVEVHPQGAGTAYGGGLVTRDDLVPVGVNPEPGFRVEAWQVVEGSPQVEQAQGVSAMVRAAGSGRLRAILVADSKNEQF